MYIYNILNVQVYLDLKGCKAVKETPVSTMMCHLFSDSLYMSWNYLLVFLSHNLVGSPGLGGPKGDAGMCRSIALSFTYVQTVQHIHISIKVCNIYLFSIL